MERRIFASCLLLSLLSPVMGQEHAGAVTGLRGGPVWPEERRVLAGSKAATAAVSTPTWSSAYSFTPDSALVAHSAVYDPSSNVMTIFGGDDWGDELTYI